MSIFGVDRNNREVFANVGECNQTILIAIDYFDCCAACFSPEKKVLKFFAYLFGICPINLNCCSVIVSRASGEVCSKFYPHSFGVLPRVV